MIVACVARPPARCSRRSARPRSTRAAFPAVQNLLLAASARGLGASATHAAALVDVGGPPDARAPRAGHAGRGRRRSGWPRGAPTPLPDRRPSATSSTSTASATSHFALGPDPVAAGHGIMVGHDSQAGDDVPRKGRARRFREARKLKQGYDDGLFREGSGTLADVERATSVDDDDDELDDDFETTKKRTGTPTTSIEQR